MDELVERIRHAAGLVPNEHFLELLRWHRAVTSLSDLNWATTGAYRRGVTELGTERATELLHDLRRAARDPRRYRHCADGKPRYRGGATLRHQYRQQ